MTPNKMGRHTRQKADLLSTKISALDLRIEGTRVEQLMGELHRDLEDAGISFKPSAYLSDGWGCPDRVPIIGIPFYFVDSRLCELRYKVTGLEPESDDEAMGILRHEAGHAFNYAYRIYASPRWGQVFGRFSKRYAREYHPAPFSARFVRHSPGWYAQKHPDDDFAETFAVWLTPELDWRTSYRATPALPKLRYVDEMATKFGRLCPTVADGDLDMPVQEMTMTLDAWFKRQRRNRVALPPIMDEDLRRLLPSAEGQLAADRLGPSQYQVARAVHRWTGIDRSLLIALVDALLERIRVLGLRIEKGQTASSTAGLSVFVTALAMNYLQTGRFIES
jgi:hypothetical protein